LLLDWPEKTGKLRNRENTNCVMTLPFVFLPWWIHFVPWVEVGLCASPRG
jgi:hypothetical protein